MSLVETVRQLAQGADQTIDSIAGLVPAEAAWAFPVAEWREGLAVVRGFLDAPGDPEALRAAAERWRKFADDVTALASPQMAADQLEALDRADSWSHAPASATYPSEFAAFGQALAGVPGFARAIADGLSQQATAVDGLVDSLDDVVAEIARALLCLEAGLTTGGWSAGLTETLRPLIEATSDAVLGVDRLFDQAAAEIDPICPADWPQPSFA